MPLAGKQWAPRELAQLCWNAGWRDKRLVISVAICLQESQGYDHAYNHNLNSVGQTISTDRGLFQINDKAHPTCTDAMAYDAIQNCAFAYQIYRDQSYTFNAWAAYTSGAFKGQANHACAGVANYHWSNIFGNTGTIC